MTCQCVDNSFICFLRVIIGRISGSENALYKAKAKKWEGEREGEREVETERGQLSEHVCH